MEKMPFISKGEKLLCLVFIVAASFSVSVAQSLKEEVVHPQDGTTYVIKAIKEIPKQCLATFDQVTTTLSAETNNKHSSPGPSKNPAKIKIVAILNED